MIVLLDQLAYLGTNLAEVFSGVISLGSLGNGDTYHYEIFDTELQDGSKIDRCVLSWDHETHEFDEDVFADSISSLTYLCSLTNAVDEELVSEDVALQGFESLRERVCPTWHFSIEEFEPLEAEFNNPRYYFWRSAWIQYFLRNNGIVDVEDLEDVFVANLNAPLTPEVYALRIEAMKTYTSTAVYSMWKAFMFDEPELEEILTVCSEHKGRVVRDCEKLIREFQNGREQLGRISNIRQTIFGSSVFIAKHRSKWASGLTTLQKAKFSEKKNTSARVEYGID